jgi:hypothetical protein
MSTSKAQDDKVAETKHIVEAVPILNQAGPSTRSTGHSSDGGAAGSSLASRQRGG